MAYSMETLLDRLEKKNKAIAERVAITMKHSKLVLKELRPFLEEKREILKLIEEAKKNF